MTKIKLYSEYIFGMRSETDRMHNFFFADKVLESKMAHFIMTTTMVISYDISDDEDFLLIIPGIKNLIMCYLVSFIRMT